MILSNSGTVATVAIALLLAAGRLEIWHFYLEVSFCSVLYNLSNNTVENSK